MDKVGHHFAPTRKYRHDPVSVHDLHATILYQIGIDHKKLTFKFQGRHYRLTDVHGKLIKPLVG